jgi:predicted amidophosphoribosyltransferase
MGDDIDKIIKIGLGVLGGFILLDILTKKCNACGSKIPPFEKRCPVCGFENA